MTKAKASRKKATPKPTGPQYPIIVETFQNVDGYRLGQMRQEEPSCWNGTVSVEKYRVTIEKVDEPLEAIHERIRKLWRETGNHHHWFPLKAAATKFGLVLDDQEWGKDRKDTK